MPATDESPPGNAPGMLDCKGNSVTVGADVLFRGRGAWLRGTVRAVIEQRYARKRGGPRVCWEASVDDGDANNPDLSTNRFSYVAWVQSKEIVVRKCPRQGSTPPEPTRAGGIPPELPPELPATASSAGLDQAVGEHADKLRRCAGRGLP